MQVKVHTALNPDTEVAISETARALVRQGFNPSESADVDTIKALSAALISICEHIRAETPKAGRHASLAITDIESAAMWAVKAATT